MSNVPFSSKNEFIEQSLPLVHYIAKQFLVRAQSIYADYDDLFSVGCVGLVKAYNSFDPEKGFQFSTYAVPSIRGEILRYFRDYQPVRVPRFEKEIADKIRRHNFERKPAAMIADHFGCKIKLVERALASLKIKVISADLPVNQDGEKEISLKDMIPDYEDFSTALLNDFLLLLTDREQTIVKSRMDGLTQNEIGQHIGITQVQVCRLLQRIAQKLTQYVEAV